MKKAQFLLLALFWCCTITLLAQNPQRIKGEVLVQLQPKQNINTLLADLERLNNKPTYLRPQRCLIPSLNIYLLSFSEQQVPAEKMLTALKKHSTVDIAQYNHILEQRNTPNDLFFPNQWQYINTGANGGTPNADIDADLAWDITTGGLTSYNDTIVVAILDDGCNEFHPDWGNNLWRNHQEIPNSIDDDGNGYIDDIKGYNTYSDNDDISGGILGGDHGTPVAGIVGAKGNNASGVTGVNWNIKLMIIVATGDEADAIAGYGYALANRQLYNQTYGARGAFVVATNASWGVNFGQPADAPIWCSLYDDLGSEGILNAGATANSNVDVDAQGDLPTACPSDFLITVTNLTNTNEKYGPAGYGTNTIDLGAYGQNTYTMKVGNDYGTFTGTSAATPHVSGAIGLLYAVACPQFIQLAKTNPPQAALLAKQFIIDGTKPNPSLSGITVSGGALNLFNTLQLVQQYGCTAQGCPTPFYIHTTNISGNFATLTWLSEQTNTNFIVQYGIEGQNPTTITTTNNTITLNMLNICSNYTVRIATLCGTDTSQYSTPYTFTTLGCCTFPQNITAIPISNNFHRIKWTPIFGALGYVVQYKTNTSTNWISIPTTDTTIVITALTPCTLYDYKVRTNCNGSISSDFSPIKNFTTLGCGACTDHTYCNSKGQSSATEWIADVQVGTWNNPSNNDNGYKDYGNISLSITRGLNYPIQLTPGFSVGAFTEYFKVWIDFNQNGTFGDDFVELIYDSQTPQTTTVNGTFTVSPTAIVGQTKMRVSMKYMEATSSPPTPCETFLFGEVEDYCLQISTDPIGYTTPSAPTIKTHWQQDILTIQCQTNNTQNQNIQITLININGQTTIKETIPTNNQNHQITTTHLPEGIYILQISNTQATYNWQQKITIIR